ncbi:MAG: hypothetical protein H6740_26045 [Alphaproteobacteria bacterium]|nr:hypothetical protein [Alphaproteobacteria bacterium]
MSLLTLLLLPGAAFAQERDLEYRASELEEQESKLAVAGGLESQYHEFDNLDLRALDESSDQSIFDTDDRNRFAFTGMSVELGYQVDPNVRVLVAASHRGLWGNDQIGVVNRFGGMIYFTGAYVEYTPTLGSLTPTIRVGRQYYELGGLGGGRDYVLADVLDMVHVRVPVMPDMVELDLMPLGIVGSSSANDNANFVSFIGQSTTQTYGFRGDHSTLRSGGAVGVTPGEALELKAYAYYTDIGALGTGSDITYNGELGNFSDNDWVANAGLRGNVAMGPATLFAEGALSRGVDRKELVARDVDTNGYALSAGARVRTGDSDSAGFSGELSFFQASGPVYDADGLLSSHGYVSMKARQVGGTITNRFMGWHPSAYVGMFGISDDPHEIDRKSGTRVIHANAGYRTAQGLSARLSWWTMQDTGTTFLDMAELDDTTPPFGYSREEFAAEARAGLTLGHEVNLDLAAELTEHLEVFGNAAYFLPGPYYEIQVSRIAGEQLGWDGLARTWAANAGLQVRW